ncbi:hypothetical protein M8C13_36750 [Crossiella sp. SN42]|uniref:hypothetical protein n=1 Tax=Crossiella sp. SN42 TaxID=2944808 RepID=UPI00207CBCCD|nr:hypothetical protein [Crossiella sp. SN42]MCO1581315.1 hypothetical protein [Crossiella sp. SN42]
MLLALVVGGSPVVVPLGWLVLHEIRVGAFRSFQLDWLAKRHGWKHKISEKYWGRDLETVRFSGTYRGYRFRVVEKRDSDGDGGESYRTTLKLYGFEHLPACGIEYKRFLFRVRVYADDPRLRAGEGLRWWMLRRPVIGGDVHVGDGVLETTWGYPVHGGAFRRKFGLLLGVAKRLEQVTGVRPPGRSAGT